MMATGDTFPRPDPTKLTTEQLVRELAHLEELLNGRIKALNDHSDLVDKAIEDRHDAFVIEINHRFDALMKRADENRADINQLRESRAAVMATDARAVVERERRAWTVGQTIAVVSSAAAAVIAIITIIVTVIMTRVLPK